MCGRVYQSLDPARLLRAIGTKMINNKSQYKPSYNTGPGENVPVLRHSDDAKNNNREMEVMKWGYKPRGGRSQLIFNARSEKPEERPLFRPLLNSKRCIVVVEGYFEWNSKKECYLFYPRDSAKAKDDSEKLVYLAALYCRDNTVVVLTHDSLGSAKTIHRRMPVVLAQDEIEKWLDCDKYKWEDIKDDILDVDSKKWKTITYRQLAPYANNSDNKDKEVLTPIEEYDKNTKGGNQSKLDDFEVVNRGDETDYNDDEETEDEEEEEPKGGAKKVVKSPPKGRLEATSEVVQKIKQAVKECDGDYVVKEAIVVVEKRNKGKENESHRLIFGEDDEGKGSKKRKEYDGKDEAGRASLKQTKLTDRN